MKVSTKRTSILIAALVILAVFVAVGFSGNQAGAVSGTTGFASTCQGCHATTGISAADQASTRSVRMPANPAVHATGQRARRQVR